MKSNNARLQKRKISLIVASIITFALIATVVLLVIGYRSGYDTKPGFLGTFAPFFADIDLIAQLVLLIGLILALVAVRMKKTALHQYVQTAFVLFNLVLTIFIMVMQFFRIVVPGIDATVISAEIWVALAHGVVGILAILSGLFLVLRMNRLLPKPLMISWWKRLMRISYALYWVVGVLGVAIYFLFYVPR
jgi:hypothetical protein